MDGALAAHPSPWSPGLGRSLLSEIPVAAWRRHTAHCHAAVQLAVWILAPSRQTDRAQQDHARRLLEILRCNAASHLAHSTNHCARRHMTAVVNQRNPGPVIEHWQRVRSSHNSHAVNDLRRGTSSQCLPSGVTNAAGSTFSELVPPAILFFFLTDLGGGSSLKTHICDMC